jgi:hypothetical protein
MKTVALSILAARPDAHHLRSIVEHLVRAHRFPFEKSMLVTDTAPLEDEHCEDDPHRPSQDAFESMCRKMVRDGVVDEVVCVDYNSSVRRSIMRKHFGHASLPTHDFRGGPIYPLVYGYEAAQECDYFLHYDSDIFLHQPEGTSWVEEAIDLMGKHTDILSATPLPGPPTENGPLKDQAAEYTRDGRGFYAFNEFTARRHMLHCERYEDLLPLPIHYLSWKRRLLSLVTGENVIWSWEHMVGRALEQSRYIRADLIKPGSWTLHALDRGSWFFEVLPHLIEKIERGSFPEKQRGRYDLYNEAWRTFLTESK